MMPVFRTLRIVSVRLVMFSQNLTSHEYTFFYEINNGAETSLLTLSCSILYQQSPLPLRSILNRLTSPRFYG